MRQAPQLPTTEQLHLAYNLETRAKTAVSAARLAFSEIMRHSERGLIDIDGPCGIDVLESGVVIREAPQVMAMQEGRKGYVKGYRVNPYKPRTNPNDWHGAETTHPEETFELVTVLANADINSVMEVAHPYHIPRYGNRLVGAWTGARNIDNDELINTLAMQDIMLPLWVKNGLDGRIEPALAHVERLNEKRARLAERLGVLAAPVALLYRGGENAQNPEEWEEAYIEAYEATNGRLGVDTAHGAEIAHDPAGEKSIEGQILAQEHIIELAELGYAPAARFAEASNVAGQTDPNMPLDDSLENGLRLYQAKMQAPALIQAA